MSSAVSSVVCHGCGRAAEQGQPLPFRCPNAGSGDDVDHVMVRVLDLRRVRFPGREQEEEENSFVRYRGLFHSYHLARTAGMTDEDYVDLVRRLDKEVASVDGRGFVVTPMWRDQTLSDRLAPGGGVWVKDETGNVSGSHKARHLMGLLIHLDVVQRLGMVPAEAPDLAIASCGNAALSAAVIARAGARPLQVFVPTWGEENVIARLRELGAHVNVVPRQDGVPGDPTYHALRRSIAGGALPFTCQGTENGLAIEGGHTLAYEMVSQLRGEDVVLDRLFVQVGGGALASAVVQGLLEATELGAIPRMPRIHAVQTEGGFPLKRAYDRVAQRALDAVRLQARPSTALGVADRLAARFRSPGIQDALRYAATHRSEFMWPWEEEPRSAASGILDDETYDWLAVVRGMLQTGGWPVVVPEETIVHANDVARSATGVDVDHTGSSGLAGLLTLHARGAIAPSERVGVLFTGVQR